MSTVTTNTMQVGLIYNDLSERTYKIPYNMDSSAEALGYAKEAIRNFNTAAATAGSEVNQTFLSDDGATVARVKNATLIVKREDVIYNG